jgi:hypothetical protein
MAGFAISNVDHQDQRSLWLRSPQWDLTWISLSALLMVMPYFAYFTGQWVGLDANDARNAVNYIVAFCIGGPHMYATYTRTLMEPTFRKRYWTIIPMAVIIPAIVVYAAIFHFIYLLTFFFFWASVHVLHQITFIVGCYRERDSNPAPRWHTWVDYAVVLTALYPMAMYRFVNSSFVIGKNTLYFPDALKVDVVWWLATAVFSLSFVLYISKTVWEFKNGTANIPKTILIGVTVLATFFTPFFNELDVAFQGLNTWHSFQYLGLTWYINRLRYERGEISRPMVRKLAAPGKWWKYYGFVVSLSITGIVMIWGLNETAAYHGLDQDQTYYMIILCFLLTHYYHDHILFTKPEAVHADVNV